MIAPRRGGTVVAERDKIEPQWKREEDARSALDSKSKKAKKRGREPETPQEPSFDATSSERRNTIAKLVSEHRAEPREEAVPSAATAARLADSSPVTTSVESPVVFPDVEALAQSQPAPPEAGRWNQLSDAQAARHPLFGIGGWLVAIALLIAAGIARALIEMIDFWATTDHGGTAAWIMAVLRSGMALWAALILGMLLGRSRAFPANFAAYSMVNVIYLALFGLAFAHVTNNAVFIGVAAAIGVTLIALVYVLHSPRVNVTYRRRVRAKRVRTGRTAA